MSVTTHDYGSGSARARTQSVEIAGVAWPLYKLQALMTFLVVALAVGVGTTSAVAAVWVATIASVAVWFTQRARHRRR